MEDQFEVQVLNTLIQENESKFPHGLLIQLPHFVGMLLGN